MGKSWTPKKGCLSCKENRISLAKSKPSNAPRVLIGLFIFHPTPFIANFFDNIVNLKYPKERITIFIHTSIDYHLNHVQEFTDTYKDLYENFILFQNAKTTYDEWQIRNHALYVKILQQ